MLFWFPPLSCAWMTFPQMYCLSLYFYLILLFFSRTKMFCLNKFVSDPGLLVSFCFFSLSSSLPCAVPLASMGCRGIGFSIYNSSMVCLVFQLLCKLLSVLPHSASSIFTSPVKSGRSQPYCLHLSAFQVLVRNERRSLKIQKN